MLHVSAARLQGQACVGLSCCGQRDAAEAPEERWVRVSSRSGQPGQRVPRPWVWCLTPGQSVLSHGLPWLPRCTQCAGIPGALSRGKHSSGEAAFPPPAPLLHRKSHLQPGELLHLCFQEFKNSWHPHHTHCGLCGFPGSEDSALVQTLRPQRGWAASLLVPWDVCTLCLSGMQWLERGCAVCGNSEAQGCSIWRWGWQSRCWLYKCSISHGLRVGPGLMQGLLQRPAKMGA